MAMIVDNRTLVYVKRMGTYIEDKIRPIQIKFHQPSARALSPTTRHLLLTPHGAQPRPRAQAPQARVSSTGCSEQKVQQIVNLPGDDDTLKDKTFLRQNTLKAKIH